MKTGVLSLGQRVTDEPDFHVPDLPVDEDQVERLLASLPVPRWIVYEINGNFDGEFLGTCAFAGKLRQGSTFMVEGKVFEAWLARHNPRMGRYFVAGREV